MKRERRSKEVAQLKRVLAHERDAAEAARKSAARWEREAVLRATAVAGALSAEILAGRRLAAAVRAHLSSASNTTVSELAAALGIFEEVSAAKHAAR